LITISNPAVRGQSNVEGWPGADHQSGQHVWISKVDTWAAELGADRVFVGTRGNPAFSFDHAYAARHYVSRFDVASLAALMRQGRAGGMTGAQVLRHGSR
jgi:hypothetical protein